MNKIFASIGIVALGGATAVQAGSAAAMAMGDNTKPWSVAATLRGFYDDNYTTSAKGSERDSMGIYISPSVALKTSLDQTTWGLRYSYGATWYQDREDLNSSNNAWDQSHEIEGLFSHSFSERFSIDASDSFVIAQEPELIAGTGVNTFPYRTEGNNIRNHAEITLAGTLTRQFSFVLGYQNTYYDYENEGFLVNGAGAVTPSLSGLLDRMEHEALVNLRWQAATRTVAILGYNYRQVDYLSDELVGNLSPFAPLINDFRDAQSRNNRSHIVYAGIEQNFTKELFVALRAGAQRTDYYNDPTADAAANPWISANVAYNYRAGSSIQIGFTHSRNQTDVVAPQTALLPSNRSLTSDQVSSVLYGTISHRIRPNLTGRLTGQWQNSTFNGGVYDSLTDTFYDLGVNLSYRFNNHFSGEIGYNFGTLNSDVPNRGYDRNRVYVGVTAQY